MQPASRYTRSLSPIIVRASNSYGPRQGHKGVQGVVTTFLSRLRANEQIEIWGDGSVVRDYLHVVDLAQLCARMISSPKVGAYNAGSGVGTSVTEIVDVLRRVTGRKIDPEYKAGRALDVPRSVLDIQKAYIDFGWAPRIAMATGISETWDWMRSNDIP